MAFRINRSFLERKEKMKKFFLIAAIICSAVLGNNVFAAENFAEKYRAAAERGNAEAQLRMGFSFLRGWGCEKNIDEAIKWMTKSAEQGHTPAAYALGKLYCGGKNEFPKDYKKAAYFTKKAAELGHVKSQFHMGYMYEKGIGVKQDMKEAVKWYRKAARRGDKMAKNHLKKLGISSF